MSVLSNIAWLLMAIASITITYQDFKDRAISWWPLVLTLLSALFLSVSGVGARATFSAWSFSVLFLVVQFALVALAFGLGKKQWNFFDHLIGWGDVLFLVAIAPLFSTVNFLIFYCVSLVISLVGFGVYKLISKAQETTVPLAGTLSICLLFFVPTIKLLGIEPWMELPIHLLMQ